MFAQGPRGLTLIELLISLSIISTLGIIGISGFNRIISNIQQYDAIHSTLRCINRARYLAVKRDERVGLCSITDDKKCTREWNGKYLAGFVDRNHNRNLDSGETIIFRQEWSQHTHIRWNDRFTDTAITYQPNGTVVSNGTVYLTDDKDQLFAKLIVNNYGRFRLETP